MAGFWREGRAMIPSHKMSVASIFWMSNSLYRDGTGQLLCTAIDI